MLRKSARYGVACVFALSGLVTALRILFGPFDIPVRVRTPLNPEAWFGLALTILLVTGEIANAGQQRERQSGCWTAFAVVALIGLTTACFWRTTHFYFLSDDFVLVNHASNFRFDTIPALAKAGGDGFFRPIGNISLALTSMWAGVNPESWHATAVALHVANVVLVFLLTTRLSVSRMAAVFASALFAIHGTRPEAATWIAGRFDLVATHFVLAGLLFFVRSCSAAASIAYVYRLASLVCMVLAILSKESAYVFPILLVLIRITNRELQRYRSTALIPFFVTMAALFAFRWWLFGGIGGYRDAHTGKAQALTFGLATIKALGLRIWTALYFPINWSTEPGAWLSLFMLAYLGALVWLATSRPNRALLGFAFGFLIVCALPPLHLLGIGAELRNSRLLYLPSVGFCLMLAVAADGLRGRGRRIVPVMILAFHIAALQHNLNQWDYVSGKSRAVAAVVVKCIGPGAEKITDFGVPGTLRGIPFFSNVNAGHLRFIQALPAHEWACQSRERASTASPVWDRAAERLRCVERR